MLCFQIGDYENQFVIHGDYIVEFKEFLETKHLIFQNAKFDLKFLYKKGIYPTKIYDTYLAECVIRCGLISYRKKKNLKAIAKDRLDIDLDKTIRDKISNEGLTTRVINYAAEDVKYLELIRESQLLDIQKWDLKHALEIENQFVIVLAYIEFCGFKLDKEQWTNKVAKNLKELINKENELNSFIKDNELVKFINPQLDLFSNNTSVKINWSSPKQVIDLFKFLKIPVSIVQDGEQKESVDAKNIEKYEKEFPIIKTYLQYREAETLVSRYGENWFRQINPVTGRIHTNFTQVMDTSRLSSGGKDKSTGEEYLNFQNIPNDKETRSCFVAENDNILIIADYSGQEQIVLANKCLDENILKFYDDGLGDMHSFVASKMYPELEGLSVDIIKKEHDKKRYNAKTAGFAINYGGVGATIARNNNVSLEEGNSIYDSYFKAFPGLKNYFEKVKREGLETGYIIFNDIIKRKSFIEGFESFLQLKENLNREFWNRWKDVKEAFSKGLRVNEYLEMKQTIRKFFDTKGAIERKSLNYPIQGTSAEITKISAIYFFKWMRENNFIGIIKIPNQIHDENVIECPLEIKDMVKEKLEECMVKAGAIFCKRVPLKVGIEESKFWKK